MYLRRRRLLLLVVVAGVLWLVLTSYLTDSTGSHKTDHAAVKKTIDHEKVKQAEYYYDDEKDVIINIEHGVTTKKTKLSDVLQRLQTAQTLHIHAEKQPSLGQSHEHHQVENDEEAYEDAEIDLNLKPQKQKVLAPVNVKLTDAEAKSGKNVPSVPEQTVTSLQHAPGVNGTAVILEDDKVSADVRRKIDDGWSKYAHNEYVSRMISLRRPLPDVRDSQCKSISYDHELPDTSVIIAFYNEAWTTLLRTVHSVLDRSPSQLLREIILVDDYSDNVNLKQQLDDYIALLPKVRLVHMDAHIGVVRARQHGASIAVGQVLVFLDSHCECTTGWLEPLLAHISLNSTSVAIPVMDIIDDSTFQYKSFDTQSINIGGFDWNLQFSWISISEREKKRRASVIEPIRSPTMSGGMYAISRNWFNVIGGYDVGMDMWGAENLEMSYRTWMCGGSLMVVPCSHVGHVFRRRSSYQLHGDNGKKSNPRKNYMRVAEVWMDEYKQYFYEKIGGRPEGNVQVLLGDITERQQLQKTLHCKSFDWYLKNVFPELFIPGNAVASGDISNRDRTFVEKQRFPACLDSIVGPNAYNQPVKIWPCHQQGGNQFWLLSSIGEIRRDDGCMDFAGKTVVIYPCHGQRGNQEWEYLQDDSIRHRSTKLCMELGADGSGLNMASCTGAENQVWHWKRNTDSGTVTQKSETANQSPAKSTTNVQELAQAEY